jgi:hypothetical protein
MHCSTSLQISPVIPRLARVCILVAILCLLVRTSHPVAVAQRLWLPVISMPSGRWYRWVCLAGSKQKVRRLCIPTQQWAPLLVRLLVRCTLLVVLLQTSGWLGLTPLCWGVLLFPIAQILTLMVALCASRPQRTRRWANALQRLYQLCFVALLVSTLGQLLHRLSARATGMPCEIFLGTSCMPFRSWSTPVKRSASRCRSV